MVPDTKSDFIALTHVQTMCLAEVWNFLLAVGWWRHSDGAWGLRANGPLSFLHIASVKPSPVRDAATSTSEMALLPKGTTQGRAQALAA